MIPLPLLAAELVAAVGAALTLGTAVALVRYWRTGTFPGDAPAQLDPSDHRAAVRWAWAKIAVGLVMLGWGIASMRAIGVF